MDDRLFEQIASPENLLAAWRAVRGNIPKYRRMRSAGPDRVSLAEFERDLPAQLGALGDMLLNERYLPTPPAQFTLKKRGGGQRQVSVLTVRDRVAQRAAQQVLEPLWEPEFLDCSFGFRPGLSIENAAVCAQNLRAHGFRWVVDGDIAACFDSLDHDLLEARLRRKIDDRRVLRLMQAWLDAGVIQAGPPEEPVDGQHGRVLSAEKVLRRGLDWALETAAEEIDPYAAARYEYGRFSPAQYRDHSEAALDRAEDEPPRSDLTGWDLRRHALKRMAASAALWGASYARPAAALARKASRATFGTPAGRRLLKKGALASGGLAGLAVAAALAAYALQRRAGPAPAGVLQGSPLSPLLANIYLHPFDESLMRRKHRLVRFADDWVILCPSQESAEDAYNDALISLARLRLKANPEKTRILRPDEPLEWLGMVIK